MPSKTPRKERILSYSRSPKTPGWVSGKEAIFVSPKSLSPKRPNTRRTSLYEKMKSTSPSYKAITQIISPKGVQTRSRRSSIFGVYKKGGIKLIDIPVTPEIKKSALKTKRSSMYNKDTAKEIQPKTNRRTSVAYSGSKDIPPKPKPSAKQVTKKVNVKPTVKTRTATKTVVKNNSVKSPVVHSPVVSLVDVISPSKETSQFTSLHISPAVEVPKIRLTPLQKFKSNVSPSTTQRKQKLEKSTSDSGVEQFKTPRVPSISTNLDKSVENVRSVTESARKSSRKTPARNKTSNETNNLTETKLGKELGGIDESLLITFKTPALSVQKSGRKRKAEEKISPPAKKCILDLSPVEKLPFKTPHKLDKSPVLMLTRTPLVDILTSTPQEATARSTPLRLSSGKKSLKQSRKSFTRTKQVLVVSDSKTPGYKRPALTAKKKEIPAKASIENSEDLPNHASLSNSNLGLPQNVTLLSDKNKNSVVTADITSSYSASNTTSHSSAGRCIIL